MIYCIGDSFTYGAELADRSWAWPTQLANLTGLETSNVGRQGCTNARIIKRAMDITLRLPGNKLIIAWTSISRLETIDEHGFFNYWPGNDAPAKEYTRASLIKLTTAMETNETLKWAHRKWLREIILLQAFLKQHNQQYLMLMSHMTQWYNELFLVQSDVHSDLGQYVDTSFFLGWPNSSMVDWVKHCPHGTGGHFLDEGHTKVAEKINEYIRNLGWLP
jgi:lysophospholipase L1-like esterase